MKGDISMFLNEFEELHGKFTKIVYEPGKLDRKTKELIAFSNSVIIDCKHCMRWHLKAAAEAGASEEEVAEAVAIAMTVSAGKARSVAKDIIMENCEDE
jgi:AhpD family alkylhydroperoxidase